MIAVPRPEALGMPNAAASRHLKGGFGEVRSTRLDRNRQRMSVSVVAPPPARSQTSSWLTVRSDATEDEKQVGRELGVRYVVEGSVRQSENRIRITRQLVDASIGTHLWADRFEGMLDDIFELQDQIATASSERFPPSPSARRRACQAEADRQPQRPR